MSGTLQKPSRLFTFRRVVWSVGLLLALSFIPWGRAPSLAGWVLAYIRGNGTPHFPIPGTSGSRIDDFFNRHPELRPEWREVPPEENGFLLLREFVESETASKMALRDELSEMLLDEGRWDQNAAREYCENYQEELSELRRIALLPQRSARGKSGGEFIDTRQYKRISDVLLLSYKQHLHANQWADAFTDFSALYGFAAHMDRHEVPNFMDRTVGILVRLAPHEALCGFLTKAPSDTDWSPWIRVLENEPSYGRQMEAVWRGELWCGMHLIPAWVMAGNEKNPIWDFTAFEDAYAARMLENAKVFANAGKFTDLEDMETLAAGFARQESSLSKAARTMLDLIQIGASSWSRGAMRAEARSNITLAALQLLQSEHEEGPITSIDDLRLGSLASDPSNGMPFIFDPVARTLKAAEGSALYDENAIQLPRW
jgi:hypothetical protein